MQIFHGKCNLVLPAKSAKSNQITNHSTHEASGIKYACVCITNETENDRQVPTQCSVVTQAGNPAFLFFFKPPKKYNILLQPLPSPFFLVSTREKHRERHFNPAPQQRREQPPKQALPLLLYPKPHTRPTQELPESLCNLWAPPAKGRWASRKARPCQGLYFYTKLCCAVFKNNRESHPSDMPSECESKMAYCAVSIKSHADTKRGCVTPSQHTGFLVLCPNQFEPKGCFKFILFVSLFHSLGFSCK